jgi:hypothetical protein
VRVHVCTYVYIRIWCSVVQLLCSYVCISGKKSGFVGTTELTLLSYTARCITVQKSSCIYSIFGNERVCVWQQYDSWMIRRGASFPTCSRRCQAHGTERTRATIPDRRRERVARSGMHDSTLTNAPKLSLLYSDPDDIAFFTCQPIKGAPKGVGEGGCNLSPNKPAKTKIKKKTCCRYYIRYQKFYVIYPLAEIIH